MGDAPAYLIDASAISEWVTALLTRAQVIAPRALQGSDAAYDAITAPEQIAWDYGSSFAPLKRHLFPQTDPLLRWRRTRDDGLELQPVYDDVDRVFLAIRPCDLSGVLFLDKVFGRDHADVYYLNRRQHSALVALACTAPGEDCFCVCAHAGPFLEAGYDLQLTPLSNQYLVEVGTDKGRALLECAADHFTPAPDEAIGLRRELARQAEQRFGEDKAYFAAALRKVTFDRVADELWEQMGERCLSCGGCAFVCPTCTCFTTADSAAAGGGERHRLWDSCLYESYTLEASGHNPRSDRKHRLKARFFHKLSYQFAHKLGSHACVGCGRCIATCLGSNDMTKVTARIRHGAL